MSKRKREEAVNESMGVEVLISSSSECLDDRDMYTYKISMKKLLVNLLSNELGLEHVSAVQDTNDDSVYVKVAVCHKDNPDSGSDAVVYSPRHSFKRKVPKLSRVAAKVQAFLRKSLGLCDFLVDIATQVDE